MIETLSVGFDHVNRILWIILIPIAVDLFLWLMPQLSAAPFLHEVARWLGAFYASMGDQVADPSTADQMRQAVAAISDGANGFNAWVFLITTLAAVPSIAPPAQAGTLGAQIATTGQFLSAFIGLEVVGTLIGCVYLGLLAQQVRDGRTNLPALLRCLPLYLGSVVGFVLLAIGLARLIAPEAGVFLSFLGLLAAQVVGMLSLIYLFFLVDAIVVSDAGPIRAARNSARVVASSFWGAVGFIIIFVVISSGLDLVWSAMSKNPIGTVAAILGNAYVASGLAAASMQYYQSRIARLAAASGIAKAVRTGD